MEKPVVLFVLQIIWLVSVLYKYLINIAFISEAFREH